MTFLQVQVTKYPPAVAFAISTFIITDTKDLKSKQMLNWLILEFRYRYVKLASLNPNMYSFVMAKCL